METAKNARKIFQEVQIRVSKLEAIEDKNSPVSIRVTCQANGMAKVFESKTPEKESDKSVSSNNEQKSLMKSEKIHSEAVSPRMSLLSCKFFPAMCDCNFFYHFRKLLNG